jgi:hypothetical protein
MCPKPVRPAVPAAAGTVPARTSGAPGEYRLRSLIAPRSRRHPESAAAIAITLARSSAAADPVLATDNESAERRLDLIGLHDVCRVLGISLAEFARPMLGKIPDTQPAITAGTESAMAGTNAALLCRYNAEQPL